MPAAPARTGPQRKSDTLEKFRQAGADVWVATAPPAGVAHLVPLSYAWNGECIVIAAPAGSVTVRNLRSNGRARLGFGPTRDVVLADCEVEALLDASDPAAAEVGAVYASQADWDPRHELEPYVFAVLRLRRVQAWREANELSGKVLMHEGVWQF